MRFAHDAEVLLARWRDLERALSQLSAGAPEAEALQAEIDVLRDEYQQCIQRAGDHHRAEAGNSQLR